VASLNYVGPPGTQDNHVVTKLETDTALSGGATPDYVTTKADQLLAPLATRQYVDTQDAAYATKAFADQQDGLLLPTTQRGAASGTVPLGSDGKVSSLYLPAVGMGLIKGPFAPSIKWTRTGITQNNPQPIARWNFANPGWQWWPIVFGSVLFWTGTTGRGDVVCRIGDQANSGYVVANGRSFNPGGDGGTIHTAAVIPASHATGETAGGGYTGTGTVVAWAHSMFSSDTVETSGGEGGIQLAMYLLRIS